MFERKAYKVEKCGGFEVEFANRGSDLVILATRGYIESDDELSLRFNSF